MTERETDTLVTTTVARPAAPAPPPERRLPSLLRAIARRALDPVLGKAMFQPLFEALLELSLAGLNYGRGQHPRFSGEDFVMQFVSSHLASRNSGRPVIFDVGANVGVYTLRVLDAFPAGVLVYAFEPSRSGFEALSANIAGFPTARVRNLGLSDKEETATLFSPGDRSKLASVYDTSPRLERFGLSVKHRERVTLTTLDRFCDDEGIDHIDLLKLDVEGHELKVLKGGANMLTSGRVDFIQFEFGPPHLESGTRFRDMFYLLNEDYVIHRVLRNGLRIIPRYREVLEVYDGATNYLAISRRLMNDVARTVH